MPDIDFSAYDLASPKHRHSLLSKIAPDRATVRAIHPQLLDLFRREMEFRKTDHSEYKEWEFDYADLIYWCGLLLFLVGDPADSPLLWDAKSINFDLYCAFDIQFLVGAGVEETLHYLEGNGHREAAEYIKSCRLASDFEDLRGWERFWIHYFYPHISFPEDPR